jgi:hypothetical protein
MYAELTTELVEYVAAAVREHATTVRDSLIAAV